MPRATRAALQAVRSDAELAPLPLAIGGHIDQQLARPAHVREVFVKPDAVAVLQHEDTQMAMLTKLINAPKPFCWVITCHDADGKWIVSQALRLYGDADKLSLWAGDPVEAFAEALDRWGLDFESGDAPVRFLPFRRVHVSPQDPGALVNALGLPADRSFDFSQTMKIEGDAIVLAWVYFIDKTAYAAAYRAGRH